MADELWTARKWIRDTLLASDALKAEVGGATPRIYQGKGEAGSSYPQIQIRYISPVGGGDKKDLSRRRVFTRARFLVVAVASGRKYEALSAAVSMIDSLLELGEGAGVGGRVIWCTREAPHNDSYDDGKGTYYTEAGAFWEVAVQAN